MMMTMMNCNIYTVSRVSVSKHYAKQGSFSHAFGIYWHMTFDAVSSPFEVCCLLSHGGARVIGILRTMCHVITDVTANHRLSSRTVRVLPVRQFTVRSLLNTHTLFRTPHYTASCLTSTHNFAGVPLQRFFWWQWYFVVLLLITSIVIGFLSVSQIVSEMTYTVSSGTLNSTIPYHSVSKYNEVLLFPPP